MADAERLTVSIPEFAELAGISKNQAYLLAQRDALGVKVIRLGKRYVLPRRAVLRLLDGLDDNGGAVEEMHGGG